jgi:hypothetical protein
MTPKTDAAAPQQLLAERRLEMQDRLAELRSASEESFGWAPKAKTWLVPVLVGAAGLVAGMAVRRLVGRQIAVRRSRGCGK